MFALCTIIHFVMKAPNYTYVTIGELDVVWFWRGLLQKCRTRDESTNNIVMVSMCGNIRWADVAVRAHVRCGGIRHSQRVAASTLWRYSYGLCLIITQQTPCPPFPYILQIGLHQAHFPQKCTTYSIHLHRYICIPNPYIMTLFSAVKALKDDILLLTESWCGAISPNFFIQCG